MLDALATIGSPAAVLGVWGRNGSSGMSIFIRTLSLLLLIAAVLTPALRWRRAAFAGFVALGLGSFALRAGWPAKPLAPRACEGTVGVELALHSFRNAPHVLLFALCFLLARAQFRPARSEANASRWTGPAAFAVTMGVGALVEVAEGVTGAGHCRLRDLLPDAAGALLGWVAFAALSAAWTRIRGHPVAKRETEVRVLDRGS